MTDTTSAHRVFFPAAALFAALAVPVWSLSFLGYANPVANLTAAWHGHEMVFGFALAVITGFLLTKVSAPALAILLLVWLSARAAALNMGLPWQASMLLQLAYPVALGVLAARPFLRSARTWRNLVFVPILAGFSVAELVFQLGQAEAIDGGGVRGLLLGADLIACLMFLMGGRITAAATSGAIQRQGERLRNPAQARLERYGLMALVGMAGGQLAGLPAVASAGAAVAALVVFWRLARWKVWKIVSRPEVFCLHLGFVWLGLGLLARAAAGLIDAPLYFVAIHGVTIGALGTFSIAIMTRTTQQRARISVRLPRAIVVALFLITLAAAARLAVDLRAVPPEFILVSAGAWSAAFAVFLGQFGAIVRKGRPHPPGQHS